MKTRLLNFWEELRSSYWFLPTLMVVLAMGLAFSTIALDQRLIASQTIYASWGYAGGPEGARTLLSTVAGSMITVASLTFSITIVALSLASSQFGPRLLSNFIRDTGNQVVLGTFIATFIYCLLVLQTIRSVEENTFVPHVSITVGVVLTLISLGVLIYFIHHMASSIQANNIIAAVSSELDHAINRLFPEKKSSNPFERELRHADDLPKNFDQETQPIEALYSGYLQAVDYEALVRIASKNDLLLHLEYRPGEFVAQGTPLVAIWPSNRYDDKLDEEVNDLFILGIQRRRTQDVEYAIHQLVEIAVRALSPGINDPFTAMTCVDRLGVALAQVAEKSLPSAYHYDSQGNLRLIADTVTFGGLTDAAFNQIRQYGQGSTAVTVRLLEALAIVASRATSREETAVLRRHAELIWRGSWEAVAEECDRDDIEAQYQVVLQVLND